MDAIRKRLRELTEAGLEVDMDIVQKYLLTEPTPSTGIKAKLDPLEMDPIGGDYGAPMEDERG